MTDKSEGEWVATTYHPFVGMLVACSACKKQVKHNNPNPNFCPNCGVKMTNASDIPRNWVRALDSF